VACNVWAQDCPDGQKCAPYSSDGNDAADSLRCVPVEPNAKKPGEPCVVLGEWVSGFDDCELGSLCMTDKETLAGECIPLCAGSAEDPSCPSADQVCLISNNVLPICLPKCDPLIQDCPDGELCLALSADFGCVRDESGDMGAFGDGCHYANACDPGLFCVLSEMVPGCEDIACCSPYCDTTELDACPGEGQECIPWYGEAVPPEGYEDVGICGVP
jgi:hypothetical protein